ncbi:hypothetical protein Lepto7375DRAFT_3317 [Leptolyngbya sp. PCC 7375]|nr:hypothetical protein Lepto7375DRAFT_3317 [Leptolyngbya sp. PCC 7375]
MIHTGNGGTTFIDVDDPDVTSSKLYEALIVKGPSARTIS